MKIVTLSIILSPVCCILSINKVISKSVSQSFNQFIKQASKQSINRSIDRFNQSIDSINRSIQSINRSIQSINQSINTYDSVLIEVPQQASTVVFSGTIKVQHQGIDAMGNAAKLLYVIAEGILHGRRMYLMRMLTGNYKKLQKRL